MVKDLIKGILNISDPETECAEPGTIEFDQAMYKARKDGHFKREDEMTIDEKVDMCQKAIKKQTAKFKRK